MCDVADLGNAFLHAFAERLAATSHQALEQLLHPLRVFDPLNDVGQFALGERSPSRGCGRGALEPTHELSYLGDGETGFLGQPHQRNRLEHGSVVHAPARDATRRLDQTDAFVVSNGRRAKPGALGDDADRKQTARAWKGMWHETKCWLLKLAIGRTPSTASGVPSGRQREPV